MNGLGNGSRSGEPLLLHGTFFPQFDVPVILLWSFIIIAGLGNWAWMICFAQTKAMRVPFNMIVFALTVSNSISTSIICPMQLSRAFTLYTPVPTIWCKVRNALKSFCFTVSLMIIFMLAALRLHAGVSGKQLKLTFRKIGAMLAVIYVLGALSITLVLDEESSLFDFCMGRTTVIAGYESGDLLAVTATRSDLSNKAVHTTNAIGTTTTLDNFITTVPTVVNEILTTKADAFDSSVENINESSDTVVQPSKVLWYSYFAVSVGLFIATVICYIALVIVLGKHHNAIKDVTLSNKKNILTMKVTAYVTITVLVSFLVPFFPIFVILSPQSSAGVLHYIAIFDCLSSLDGALSPIIYYFSNPVYKAAFNRIVLHLAQKVTSVFNHQVTPDPSHVGPNVPAIIHIEPGPLHAQQVAPL